MVAAIEYLVEQNRNAEMVIDFHHQVQFRHLARPLESAIFRVAQESLTNACRYSHSARIEVELTQIDGTVQLRVQDWGSGFDPQRIPGGHVGIRGIRERARLLGGTAEVVSAPDAGTTVLVRFPLVEQPLEGDGDDQQAEDHAELAAN